MRVDDLFETALTGVTSNKSRSLLTMLGIIIGVGSVILMSSAGNSFSNVILSNVSSLGANTITISPGGGGGGPGGGSSNTKTLTMDDVTALSKLSTITNVSPTLSVSGDSTNGNRTSTARATGVTADYFKSQSIEIQQGRLLDSFDDKGQRLNAVIGPDTATDLFGSQQALGKQITLANNSFTIVGITKAKGGSGPTNSDRVVYIPFSTAKGLTGSQYADSIIVTAKDSVDLATYDAKSLLRQRHHIQKSSTGEYQDDFSIFSSQAISSTLSTVTLALTVFLSAIAGISLVVGGIGIMNIMLVTVTERTKEIGLRKALGAKRADILSQFLIEAMLLTLTGGVIGIASGLGIAYVASLIASRFLATYAFAISLSSILIAVGLSTAVGLIFGINPARKAAQLSPMEALRYE
jgi:ABC-type antimicrobial peptide transport system permease subunit